jgi:hypothetical protein
LQLLEQLTDLCQTQNITNALHAFHKAADLAQPLNAAAVRIKQMLVLINGHHNLIATEFPLQPPIRRQKRIILGKHVLDAAIECDMLRWIPRRGYDENR